jgi:MYXO-CTERM domain-containing protein
MAHEGVTGFAMLLVGVAALAWGRRRKS